MDDTPQMAIAARANFERGIAEFLNLLDMVIAIVASIHVGWHTFVLYTRHEADRLYSA